MEPKLEEYMFLMKAFPSIRVFGTHENLVNLEKFLLRVLDQESKFKNFVEHCKKHHSVPDICCPDIE